MQRLDEVRVRHGAEPLAGLAEAHRRSIARRAIGNVSRDQALAFPQVSHRGVNAVETDPWTLPLAIAAAFLALSLVVSLARERLPLLEILAQEARDRETRNPDR